MPNNHPSTHGPRRIVPLTGDVHALRGLAPVAGAAVARVQPNEGHIILSADVVPVYWGATWIGADAGLASRLDAFFDFIVKSSYLDMLEEYRTSQGIPERGRRLTSARVSTSEPGTPTPSGRQVSDTQIGDTLKGWVDDHTLPAVTANTLFFVFLPPNTTSTGPGSAGGSCSSFCGYHSNKDQIYYAVIPYANCASCVFPGDFFDTLTEIVSHELAEAITDPDGKGWWDSAPGGTGNEIGDICNRQTTRLGTFLVQTEWSEAKGACIVGTANILWHNSVTHETQMWIMAGTQVARRATILDENRNPIFIGPPWRIVGTGDFTGGTLGIVWHNDTTNETQIWVVSRGVIQQRWTVVDENGRAIFVGSPWEIVGAGDLDANGRADIVWHNSVTNETQVWLMSRSSITRRMTVVDERFTNIFVGSPWRVAGVGDANFDGRADLVWHNSTTNETQIWFMRGHHIERRQTVVDEHNAAIFVGGDWRLVGVGDFGGDRRADIAWHNSRTNETQVWLMSEDRIVQRVTVQDEAGKALLVGNTWAIVGISPDF